MTFFEHLFTPWRMKFIKEGKKAKNCVLCELIKLEDGPANLVLYRGQFNYVVMNKYPYNTGHIMVVPYVHSSHFEQIKHEVLSEMMELAQKMMRLLLHTHAPEGFNMGINAGKSAGAGIPDHLHYHLVPRWTGDTNFMPLFGGTRVLPETVEETYERLQNALSTQL